MEGEVSHRLKSRDVTRVEEVCTGEQHARGGSHTSPVTQVVVYLGGGYAFPAQEEEADDTFVRQLGKSSQSEALAHMGDFDHLSIYCRRKMAGHNQSRTSLVCMEDKYLMQDIHEKTMQRIS